MIFRARFAAATVGLLLAVAPLAFPGTASAAGADRCGGAKQSTQSWALVNVDCSRAGSGAGGKTKDPSWITVKRYQGQTCTDANGRKSYMGVVYQPSTGKSTTWCLLQAGGAGADVVDTTSLQINAPKPTADFGDRFLVGAEITFTVPEMTSYVQGLQQFPGATVTATPVRMAWDFGNGDKSSDISPKYTFRNDTPDKTKPNDHVAHVTVTGTWQLYLHPANEGVDNPVQDLGEVALTGQLDRPIVPVYSAPTEPKQNA